MILLDTHVLAWWVNQDKPIPPSVLKVIRQSQEEKEIYLSAITFWEVALLYKKEKINLTYDLHTWFNIVLSIPALKVINLDPSILITSVLLEPPFHADPADRIIVATAQKLGATLISKDDKILKYPHVKSFWRE